MTANSNLCVVPAVRKNRAERGTAYIIALLVLLVLTIVGLSLALVTQSEVQIGANERQITRVFAAADAAMGELAADLFVNGNQGASSRFVPESGSIAGTNLGIRVERSNIVRLNSPYCNLCEINQSPGDEPYRANTYAIATAAFRSGTTSSGTAVPLSEKRLEAMLSAQPLKATIVKVTP